MKNTTDVNLELVAQSSQKPQSFYGKYASSRQHVKRNGT